VRAGIIESVLSTIKPNIFLVDHEPAGAMDELRPVLSVLKKKPYIKTILGLRDILDDPDRTKTTWAANGIDHLITEAYDQVLIYGDARFFPTAKAYGLDSLKPTANTVCGVVTTVRQQKRKPSLIKPARIVVSGGGGRDAFPLMRRS